MPHASASASPAGLPLARALFWGGIALAVVFAAAGATFWTIAITSSQMLYLAIGAPVLMFGIFTSYPIMFGAFRLQAEKRMQTVAALHPDAFVLHVVMRPKIAGQFIAYIFCSVQCIFEKYKIKGSPDPGDAKCNMHQSHHDVKPFH